MNKKHKTLVICKYICGWSIVVMLIFANIILWYLLYDYKFCHQLEPREATIQYVFNTKRYDISEYDARVLVENELQVDLYRYTVNNDKVPDGSTACCDILTRTVYMLDKYQNVYDYGISLAHELVHIKYVAPNEAWVAFKTFTILYESKSMVLQDMGRYYGNYLLSLEKSNPDFKKYGVGFYIQEYIKK